VKKIEAIIQPFKMDEVKAALLEVGVSGMTISEVRGNGRQAGRAEIYRGQEYSGRLLAKIKIEIVVDDASSEEVIRAIIRSARTGKIGDGKIFVFPVKEAIRIRNDQINEAAL
jgi:nitrogen regulatory protein P-II 1